MKLKLFFIFFLLFLSSANALLLEDYYQTSTVNYTQEGCGGQTVTNPNPSVLDGDNTAPGHYCDRTSKLINLFFTEDLTITNGTFTVNVAGCASYAWEDYVVYDSDMTVLGTVTGANGDCSGNIQTLYFSTVTTDTLRFDVQETNLSQDWGYGNYTYVDIREFNVTSFTTTYNASVGGNISAVVDETRGYLDSVPDGEDLFNKAFFFIIFAFLIGVMMYTGSASFGFIIAGVCGLLASWLISGDATQMVTSATMIGLGVTFLLARLFG